MASHRVRLTVPGAWARLAAGGLVAALTSLTGCGSDLTGPSAPAPHGQGGGASRDAGTASVSIFDDAVGWVELDVAAREIRTAEGRVALEEDDLPEIAQALREIARHDAYLQYIDRYSPPPAEGCNTDVRPDCGPVWDQRAPGGEADAPSAAAQGGVGLGAWSMPAATPSAFDSGDPQFSCTQIWEEVQKNKEGYRLARRDLAVLTAVITGAAGKLLKEAGMDVLGAPWGELPKWKGTIKLLEKAGTWGGFAVVAAGTPLYQTVASAYAGQGGKIGLLVFMFNQRDCGNRIDWPPPNSGPGSPGGGSGGQPMWGLGPGVTIMCRFTDHYFPDGRLWYTERHECWAQTA